MERPTKKRRLNGPDGFAVEETPQQKTKNIIQTPIFQSAFTPQRKPPSTSKPKPRISAGKIPQPNFGESSHSPESAEKPKSKSKTSLKLSIPLSHQLDTPIAAKKVKHLTAPVLEFSSPSSIRTPIWPRSMFTLPSMRQETRLKGHDKPMTRLNAPSIPSPIDSNRSMRTIYSTSLARATDFLTEDGTAELASIFLHNYDYQDLTDVDRGLQASPQKKGVGFVKGGLASQATAIFNQTQTSSALWNKEITHIISSSSSKLPKPDLKLHIIEVLDRPITPTSNPYNSISISTTKDSLPALALCGILSARTKPRSTAPPSSSFPDFDIRPLEEEVVMLLRISPQTLCYPRASDPTNLFVPETEVWVWKPWQRIGDVFIPKRLVLTSSDSQKS